MSETTNKPTDGSAVGTMTPKNPNVTASQERPQASPAAAGYAAVASLSVSTTGRRNRLLVVWADGGWSSYPVSLLKQSSFVEKIQRRAKAHNTKLRNAGPDAQPETKAETGVS